MYLYYLLGFKLMTKFYERWQKGETDAEIKPHIKVRAELLSNVLQTSMQHDRKKK